MLEFGSTRLIAGMLAGVSPGDPLTLAAVALTIVLVAATASALPALRAASVHASDSPRAD